MENIDDTNILLTEDKLPKGNPFVLPEDYFETLESKISARLAIKDEGKQTTPFTIPENYFDNLPKHIENKIAYLYAEQSVDTYYFENLTQQIESKTSLSSSKKTQKLINIRWAYAAAASVLMCFGIFYNTNYNPAAVHYSAGLYPDSLSTRDIVGVLKNSDISDEEFLIHIDVKDISSQLKIEEKDESRILEELDESDLTQNM